MWARSFGAKISPILSKSTTHVVAHKDRRTSKVRQAARYPKIQIVTISWLLQCFTRWTHADEGPHLILVEREDHGPQDSLPFDDLEDGVILTPSEDGGDDAALPDGNEPLLSPIGRNDVEWGSLDEEFENFFGDLDGDDTENDETDRESGGESDASTQSTSSRKGKRKRSTKSVDGTEDSDDTTNGQLGSELQKRKKRALERTTGLANVSSADNPSGLPSPDTTGPEEDAGEKQHANGDKTDDDLDDDFEREMMAEFERQSNEPEED
jgi:RNA polymerase II subunit A-like phosphatase